MLAILVIAPVITADVIYYYQGAINVYTTSQAIQLAVGPNGNVSFSSGTDQVIILMLPLLLHLLLLK